MNFKPLLAAPVDLAKLRFPVLVSPKIDGIRGVTGLHAPICTRSLKPIPNHFIQTIADLYVPPHLDGELVTTTGGVVDDFNSIQSKVMSIDGRPDFEFHVFDCWSMEVLCSGFSNRLSEAADVVADADLKWLKLVPHVLVRSVAELAAAEDRFVKEGWEGAMIRDPDGPYKFGRSTVGEGTLLKMKRFEDAEAIIVSCVQRLRNTNEPTVNALGYQERSHLKAGMVPDEAMGAFLVMWGETLFEVGTGFTEAQRIDFWKRRNELLGAQITFKYQGVGSQNRPRFPVFVGFRDDL